MSDPWNTEACGLDKKILKDAGPLPSAPPPHYFRIVDAQVFMGETLHGFL